MIGNIQIERKGFSLIEMLVVVTIIGVLATAAVPVAEISFVGLKESELKDNLAVIRSAIQSWRKNCQQAVERQVTSRKAMFDAPDALMYPPSLIDLVKPDPAGYPVNWHSDAAGGDQNTTFYPKPYLNKLPEDPFIGGAIWTVYYASGTATNTYYSPDNEPRPALASGVFDVSPVASPTLRKGFVTSIDGTKYENW